MRLFKAVPFSRVGVRRGPRAFTLVELLVVIGIIALLIAILLPVLARVREQAVTLKCLANLRTCGQAFEMYADEHKGCLPYPLTTLGEQTLWFTAIDQYLSSIANAYRTGVAAQRSYSEYKQCPLVNNLYSLGDNSGDGGAGGTAQNTTTEDTKSYKMNSCLRHFVVATATAGTTTFSQARVSQVPNSSSFVLLGDGISMDITGITPSQTQSGAFDMDVNGKTLGVASCPVLRHRGACNILFVDGHAESENLPLETVTPKVLTGTPATPVPTWQAEYLDSTGTEVWMKSVTPPATTTPIATRNPSMPLQWSLVPTITR